MTSDDRELKFWEHQKHLTVNRSPMFSEGEIETDDVIEKSKIWNAFGSLVRNLTNFIRSRLQ